jgi:hypothetical protein
MDGGVLLLLGLRRGFHRIMVWSAPSGLVWLRGGYPGRRPLPTRGLPWAVVGRPVGAGGRSSGKASPLAKRCAECRLR